MFDCLRTLLLAVPISIGIGGAFAQKIQNPALISIVAASGTQVVNVASPPYLAVPNGITDNTTVLQDALNDAYRLNVPVYFPGAGGCYLTGTLTYQGQQLLGDGEHVSCVQGKPAQDVFLAPDPSLGASGSLADFPQHFRVENLRIIVDSSGSPSFTRPVYPIVEAWTTGHNYTFGEYITGANGAVYYCTTAGTAGSMQPSQTAGIASDGGASWLYVDTGQHNVENAAFAFPFGNGAGSGKTTPNISPYFNNVLILDNQAGSNMTGGIYTQRPMYAGRLQNTAIRFPGIPLAMVPPTINWGSSVYDSDTLALTNIEVFERPGQLTPGIILNNIDNATFSNLALYASNVGNLGMFLLQFDDRQGIINTNDVFTEFYSEENSATIGQLHLFMGNQIYINSGNIEGLGSGGTFGWYVDGGTIANLVGDPASNVLQIYGNYNTGWGLSLQYPNSTIFDGGIGNNFSFGKTASAELLSERQISIANRSRPNAFIQRQDFVQGFTATPFDSLEDMLIGGREFIWEGATAQNFVSSALETGGYARTPPPGGNYASRANGAAIIVGGRVPATKVRVYVKLRAIGSGTDSISLRAGATTVGSTTASISANFSVVSFDADLTNYSGDTLQFGFGDPSINSYMDVAWVAFRPYPADVLAQTVVLGYLYSAAGTALPACNAGTKGAHATVSDATSPTYLGSYVSGGSLTAPVFCNGTSWLTD
jgi:hypothetical protein